MRALCQDPDAVYEALSQDPIQKEALLLQDLLFITGCKNFT